MLDDAQRDVIDEVHSLTIEDLHEFLYKVVARNNEMYIECGLEPKTSYDVVFSLLSHYYTYQEPDPQHESPYTDSEHFISKAVKTFAGIVSGELKFD